MYARENEIGMKARDLAVPSTPTTEGSPEIDSGKTDYEEIEGRDYHTHHASQGNRQSKVEMYRMQMNTASEPAIRLKRSLTHT